MSQQRVTVTKSKPDINAPQTEVKPIKDLLYQLSITTKSGDCLQWDL